MMRRLVTFVLRLWVDAGTEGQPWQGEVECVATGEHTRFRRREDLLHFIESSVASPPEPGSGNAKAHDEDGLLTD